MAEEIVKVEKRNVGRPIQIPTPWGELSSAIGGSELLAEKLGVARSTLNKWANGVHRVPEMTLKEVRRLCKHYEIECSL